MQQRGRKCSADSLDLAFDEGTHLRIQRELRFTRKLESELTAEDARILDEMARLEGRTQEKAA